MRPTHAAILVLLLAALPAAAAQRTLDLPVYLHELPTGGLHVVPDAMAADVGDTLRLTVLNQGVDHDNRIHNLLVCGDGPEPRSSCADKWAFTPILQNNQTAVLTFVAKRAGEFAYYCDIAGHASAGMRGLLQVRGAGEEGGKGVPGSAIAATLMSLGLLALLRRR